MLQWYGKEIEDDIANAASEALLNCAVDLQDISVNRAPIDTGKLRENCVIDDSELDTTLTVIVGYSREVDKYSIVQHERLDFNHPNGGEAKYLENPFNENTDKYIKYLANKVGDALK